MPTFEFPDSFKEHKQYVVLLKKALLVVKPGVEKKFLYYAQYPFGKAKFPLVLVDYALNCTTMLAKAGYKPTAEGLVTLTAGEELNFEASKGTLKRIKLRKYIGKMPKQSKAAVATFADWSSGDPETLGLGSKVDALKAFKEFSK